MKSDKSNIQIEIVCYDEHCDETISAGLWLVLVAISPATSVFDRKPPQTICFALQPSALTPNQQPLPIQQTAYLKPFNFLTSYIFHCSFYINALTSANMSALFGIPTLVNVVCLTTVDLLVSHIPQVVKQIWTFSTANVISFN